jgi:four helix bundle protein
MARIKKFEELEAWKKARDMGKAIYRVTSTGSFPRDFGLRDQIRRAGVSAMSNIAEGFERGGDKEFRQFLAVAKGSVGEVKSQLYVALDAGFLTAKAFDDLYALATETSRLIAGLMRYLKDSDFKGVKYKE